MGAVAVNFGSTLGTPLQTFLLSGAIVPGTQPGYQLCKDIYVYHPLGNKMAEGPIRMAQSQKRELAVPAGPEIMCREKFEAEWEALGADRNILNVAALSRIYGISSIALVAEGLDPATPVDYTKLWDMPISFNVYDPLNTAGSLVLNQNPNAVDFQKHGAIAVSGVPYHVSRTCTIMNESPLYIEYTNSAFGFVGRSVYQRALFPLKSFVQSMITDDMVTRKAGLIIAMMKQVGAIVDKVMSKIWGEKRDLLKEAQTNNVLSVGDTDKIETLNMQNLDGAYGMARKNILENIATAADMPAKLLNAETFAEGFGEGTEDAKYVAQYIDRVRIELQPLYGFFDKICRYRAWNPKFYEEVQAKFPDEYGSVDYNTAFQAWSNSFKAVWPSLLREPDSEKIKVDDVRLKAVIALLEVLLPIVDPENKGKLVQWAQDNFNALKLLFDSPLELDAEAIANYVPPMPLEQQGEPTPGKPFSASDAAERRAKAKGALAAYDEAVRRATTKDKLAA